MKTNKTIFSTILLLAALTLSSCGTYYEYIQVLNAKPMNNYKKTSVKNGGIVYEDDNCAVFYKFWQEGGDAGFEFYNKTKNIIYVDLSKTFFIKNGVAYDYYTNQTVTDTKATSTTTSTSVGYGLTSTRSYSASIAQYYDNYVPAAPQSPVLTNEQIRVTKTANAIQMASANTSHLQSTSVAVTANPILAIPPHTSKFVKNYSIVSKEFVSCDLKYYPDGKDRISFTEENSPIKFANYITFKIGSEGKYKVVENKFYVSDISNYIKQDVTEYIQRDKTCENLLTPKQIKKQHQMVEVYDAFIIVGNESSFYTTYKMYSNSKIYRRTPTGYLWSEQHQGYIK